MVSEENMQYIYDITAHYPYQNLEEADSRPTRSGGGNPPPTLPVHGYIDHTSSFIHRPPICDLSQFL